MRTEILNILQQEAEEGYRIFSAKLLPPDISLLGVRIPRLRQIAKQLVKAGKGNEYLNIPVAELKYQEELMLRLLILANLKIGPKRKIGLVSRFVSDINSWAVCDIFCGELKEVKKCPAEYYNAFLPYAESGKEYQIRFFYVMALGYFITSELLSGLFTQLSRQKYVGFYDKMAAAWFLSVAYVKFPTETERFLLKTPLDNFVFRKSVSKICDSFRVKEEAKIRLRKLASAKMKMQ